MQLDKNSPLTLTYQLTELIRKQIIPNLKPGDKLPTEKELLEQFDVSVITIKNALDVLVHEGLIYRKRGKGTFISEKKISSDTGRLTSATELFEQSGHESQVMLLEMSQQKAGSILAEAFGCSEDEPVLKLVRLRSLDNEAYSYEKNYVLKSLFPDLERKYRSGSLYACMENEFGIIPSHSEETYKAIGLDSQIAKLLNQNRGNAAFDMFGKVYDQFGRVISVERSIYRGDKFELKVNANSFTTRGQRLIENDN